MSTTATGVTIAAVLGLTHPMNFPCITAGQGLLHFDLTFTSNGAQPGDDDVVRFVFRNLFSGVETTHEFPFGALELSDGLCAVELSAGDVDLQPGSYHVRVDLLRDGQSLCGPRAGSCELYVSRKGESANHVLGSYFLWRVAYAWHPERRLYNRSIPKTLPPDIDPFHKDGLELFWERVGDNWELHPELQHDGGVAFLHGSEVFRATGEMDRAQFCDTVLRHTIEGIFDNMLAEDGRLHAIRWQSGEPKQIYHVRQQDCFVLKVLSQAYLHFRDTVGDEEYAQSVYDRMQPMVAYNFSQPNPLGCGGSCKVYDGRILAGLAYYCLTQRACTGQFDDAHAATVLDFAERAARHCLAERGWYDDNCYVEGKCHIGFGTQNIMCGLLPSRRIALAAGKEELADYLGDAAMAGFDFLARTNGKITGYMQWIPSRHSQWANGNMHEILDEIRGQIGTSETLGWYYDKLWQPTYDFWVLAFHRCDILATPLLECAEYKEARGSD